MFSRQKSGLVLGAASRRRFLQGGAAVLLGANSLEALGRGAEAAPPRFLTQWGKRGKGAGEFDILIGIAINRKDEVFVTEFRNNRVQKFDSKGVPLSMFPVGEMPGGIAIAPNGDIYVAHMLSGVIRVYSPEGALLREWGGNGKGDGQFGQPGGIAISPAGAVYIADQVNRRIQQFTLEGAFVRKWGDYGVAPGQFGGSEHPASRTGGPHFIALDRRGDLYTTEGSVGRVQKFSPEGKYLLSWGDNSENPGGFGGRPKNLPGPIAIVVDRRNRVWVSATNHWVQQFSPEGRLLYRMGGAGTEPGQFVTPHGLAIDSRGDLYVCDTQNARIQKFAIP